MGKIADFFYSETYEQYFDSPTGRSINSAAKPHTSFATSLVVDLDNELSSSVAPSRGAIFYATLSIYVER